MQTKKEPGTVELLKNETAQIKNQVAFTPMVSQPDPILQSVTDFVSEPFQAIAEFFEPAPVPQVPQQAQTMAPPEPIVSTKVVSRSQPVSVYKVDPKPRNFMK